MMTVKIKGDRWKIFSFDHDEFVKRFGDGMSAFCDTKQKQMFFVAEDLDLPLVLHEIFHAFTSYLRLDAVDLSAAQTEEIYSEMFAQDGPKMLETATKIFEKMRGLE